MWPIPRQIRLTTICDTALNLPCDRGKGSLEERTRFTEPAPKVVHHSVILKITTAGSSQETTTTPWVDLTKHTGPRFQVMLTAGNRRTLLMADLMQCPLWTSVASAALWRFNTALFATLHQRPHITVMQGLWLHQLLGSIESTWRHIRSYCNVASGFVSDYSRHRTLPLVEPSIVKRRLNYLKFIHVPLLEQYSSSMKSIDLSSVCHHY